MKKEDNVNLAAGNCFNKTPLTPDQCDLILKISINELINKYGFNEIQSRQIKNWCDLECSRRRNDYIIDRREEVDLNSNKGYFRT